LNALPSMAALGGPITVAAAAPFAGATANYTLTFGGALAGFAQGLIAVNVAAPVSVSTAAANVTVGGGGTTVAAGAALEISGTSLSIPEGLTISGSGFNSIPTGAVRMLDFTPGSADADTLTASIVLGANAVI